MTRKRFVGRTHILAAAIAVSMAASAAAQPRPFAVARTTVAAAKGQPLTPAAAAVIAQNLVDNSVCAKLLGVRLQDPALVAQLAAAQLDWQSGRFRGVQEEALIKSLNRQLGLETSSEYSRIRPWELRRTRLLIWTKLPELSTGLDRRGVHTNGRQNIFGPFMSPFEAYVVIDWVIYSKTTDSDFSLTLAEESAREHAPQLDRTGLYAQPVNARLEEFRKHLVTLAGKWQTSNDLVASFADLLGR